MPTIAYTVTATFPDQATMDEYIAWLQDGHVDQVIACGAHSVMIVRLDRPAATDPHRVEARYLFSTRSGLDHYIKDHAPLLRAQGLARFPPERGISFARTTGEVS
jgi:hypothetical protein